MSELVEFVRRMLDEDEQTARNAGWDDPNWRYDRDRFRVLSDEDRVVASHRAEHVETTYTPYHMLDSDGTHIARHDPARVLREVAAQRRVISMYEDACHRAENAPNADAVASARVARSTLQGVLTVMAQVHKEHPDFREEWAL